MSEGDWGQFINIDVDIESIQDIKIKIKKNYNYNYQTYISNNISNIINKNNNNNKRKFVENDNNKKNNNKKPKLLYDFLNVNYLFVWIWDYFRYQLRYCANLNNK